MHDVEVDVVDAKPSEAAFGLHRRVRSSGIELGRDEHLIAGQAALAQRPADALLVAVGLSGIDMSVAELERPAHGVHALGPVGHLPHAQSEQRHLIAIREHTNAAACRHRVRRHRVFSARYFVNPRFSVRPSRLGCRWPLTQISRQNRVGRLAPKFGFCLKLLAEEFA